MQLAGINKYITFHCARHTFAITSLILGMKLEVVSDILGHSEISTTQRYARIVDRLREKEMDKWDQLVKEELEDNMKVICPDCDDVVFEYKSGLFISGSFTLNCNPVVTNFCINSKFSFLSYCFIPDRVFCFLTGNCPNSQKKYSICLFILLNY
jgi:hypothetical protein